MSNKTSKERVSADDDEESLLLPKVAVAVVLLAIGSLAFYLFGVQHLSLHDIGASLDELVRSYGPWGPVIFVAAYVTATVVLIPSTALSLAAG